MNEAIRLTLTLALIGFLLAIPCLLWLRREEQIRAEQIEDAAQREQERVEIWTAPEPPDSLYGLPNLKTRILTHNNNHADEPAVGPFIF